MLSRVRALLLSSRGWFIALCLLAPVACLAQAPIEVGPKERGDKRTGLAEIWHDPAKNTSLADIEQILADGGFTPLVSAGSTGLQPGAFWSHFTLRNVSDETLSLHLEYIDHQLIALDAFAKNPAQPHFQLLASLSLAKPFEHRLIEHNRFVVPVTLAPGQTRELLVKFSSDDKGFVFPSMRIWTADALQVSHTSETAALGFLFGAFFLMSIFALVCGIATSEKVFYAYSVYSLSKISVWATVLGYTHQYLLTDNFHWSYMSISGAVTIFCGLLFARVFLQTARYTRKLDYLLRFMMANALFLLVCALFRLTGLSVIAITIALLLYPVLCLVAFVRWRQGSNEAAVFGLAWSLLVCGLVVQALRDLGFVPHNMVNYYWPPVASFTEMLTIMAAMGIKVQRLRHQKEHAEYRYTEQLLSSKVELEALVLSRTRELEEAKLRAETEARTDALTGIHNRRSFFDEANKRFHLAQRKGQALSVLMFDIDHFKSINDKFGHAVGDEALKKFSDTVAKHIRDSDIFGRLGGEEFALLLCENRLGTLDTALRLRRDIATLRLHTDDGLLQFTASIGIAYWQGEESVEALLNNADNALYLAKNQGRNQVVEHSCPVGGADTLPADI